MQTLPMAKVIQDTGEKIHRKIDVFSQKCNNREHQTKTGCMCKCMWTETVFE